MGTIVSLVGAVVAAYLTLLTLVLTYLGFADLGADGRERDIGSGTRAPEEGASLVDAGGAD